MMFLNVHYTYIIYFNYQHKIEVEVYISSPRINLHILLVSISIYLIDYQVSVL